MADAVEPIGNGPSIAERIRAQTARAKELGARRPDEQALTAALLDAGKLTPDQIRRILEQAALSQQPFDRVLRESRLLTQEEFFEMQAHASGLPFVSLGEQPRIPDSVLALLAPETIRNGRAIPYRLTAGTSEQDEDTVWIALADPRDGALRKTLSGLLAKQGKKTQFVVAPPQEIDKIVGSQRLTQAAGANVDFGGGAEQDARDEEDEVDLDSGPAPQLFNEIFGEAMARRASDVHLVPGAGGKGLAVRMRIDGVMQLIREVPETLRRPLISVVKLRFQMNLTEKRHPISGRIALKVGGRVIDLRGEYAPLVGDREQVVVRLLDKEGVSLNLDEMGFSKANLEAFRALIHRPQGCVLVTGPTGSGKSTTLYAALKEIATEEHNVITVEDPVEYQLDGIQQMQVNNNITPPFDFAEALRSVLRSDPDIVMVGEIRDEETAGIALRASTTGHLVLSTLHTNYAAAAPEQLLQMDVKENQVVSALTGVVAQRLVRRLCVKCKIPYTPSLEELTHAYDRQTAEKILADIGRFRYHRANEAGCSECTRGFKGRLPVHEILTLGEEERLLLLDKERRSPQNLRRIAEAKGMRGLRLDGLDKAAMGHTTISEIMRVISRDD